MKRRWMFWGPGRPVEPEVRTFFRSPERLARIAFKIIVRYGSERSLRPIEAGELWRSERGLFEFWPSRYRPVVFRVVVPPVGHAPGWDANGAPVEGE